MTDETIIFFMSVLIGLLIIIIFYQQFAFGRGTQAKLREMSRKLKDMIETDSNEQMMVFTGNKELMELTAQINALLEKNRKMKTEYRRSEMASRKMLSNISHDIKTPMTVILGYLEIMRLNEGGTREMIQKAEKKAHSVMELINQFFTLAKLEAGDMDLTVSKVDVCEICKESILDFYEILTKDGFEVDVSLPETPVYIHGNKDALQRILSNLISNAIRYGGEGKYLGICLRDGDKEVCVDVADKGKGIEKAFADKIFDRLFTLEDSRSRRIQGNGLGLTIAKNLAIQLGGTLTVNSVPHSRTTFTVTLKKMLF